MLNPEEFATKLAPHVTQRRIFGGRSIRFQGAVTLGVVLNPKSGMWVSLRRNGGDALARLQVTPDEDGLRRVREWMVLLLDDGGKVSAVAWDVCVKLGWIEVSNG